MQRLTARPCSKDSAYTSNQIVYAAVAKVVSSCQAGQAAFGVLGMEEPDMAYQALPLPPRISSSAWTYPSVDAGTSLTGVSDHQYAMH